MTPADEANVKSSKRLLYALHNMQLVIEACQVALNHAEAHDNFKHIWGASITTLYAAPFTEGQGLGTPHGTYQKFPDKVMENVHNALLEARHQFYADRDLQANINKNHDILIIITPNKEIRAHTLNAAYLEQDFPHIIALCDFQLKRFRQDAHHILLALQLKHEKAVGQYTLGIDFP